MLQSSKHILGLIVIIGFLSYIGLHIFYYEHTSPTELATKLIEEDKDANNCFLLRTFDIGPRPTTYELQMRCVYKYASLTKDPSACELLMPSDYGWSCLGAVEEKLFLGDPCYYSTVRNRVYCNRKYSEGELTIEDPQMDNCSSYERNDLREWCHFERTARIAYAHECDQITHPVVYDNCEYNYAIKMKDIKYCDAIKDPERINMCKVYLEMVKKYK
ncbi:hypothetical protein KJ652_00875 [Patescibacteria group bacterium]|nr:hypothetical protein [Patescibacteria group bacterium]